MLAILLIRLIQDLFTKLSTGIVYNLCRKKRWLSKVCQYCKIVRLTSLQPRGSIRVFNHSGSRLADMADHTGFRSGDGHYR